MRAGSPAERDAEPSVAGCSHKRFASVAAWRIAAGSIAATGLSVIVVGHEPSISNLGAFLLGRPAFPPFRTAQCYAVEDGKPTWTARSDIDQVQPYFVE